MSNLSGKGYVTRSVGFGKLRSRCSNLEKAMVPHPFVEDLTF